MLRFMSIHRLRSFVPPAVRRPIRRAITAVGERRQARALAKFVRTLQREVQSGAINPALLANIRTAWGNEAFSVDQSFLAEVAARCLRNRGNLLDCGSGLSTIVAGTIAEVCGGHVWSLEQDRSWYESMRRVLRDLKLTMSVTLWHAPLRVYGDFVWFDIQLRSLPPEFTYVFCDGPAVFPTEWPDELHGNWRMGVVPVLQTRGVRFGEILLDDAEDERCPRVRDRWAELGVPTEIVTTPTGPFVLGRTKPVR